MLSQSGKAVDGIQTINQYRVVTEQLATVINHFIAVAVPHQQPIVRSHPTGKLGKTVTVMVKLHPGIKTDRADAIPIQVKDDGGSLLLC